MAAPFWTFAEVIVIPPPPPSAATSAALFVVWVTDTGEAVATPARLTNNTAITPILRGVIFSPSDNLRQIGLWRPDGSKQSAVCEAIGCNKRFRINDVRLDVFESGGSPTKS